jgi:hypothetical protein
MWWKWALVLAASVGMLQLGICFSGAKLRAKLIPGILMASGSLGCGIWWLVTDQRGAKLVAGIAALVFLGLVVTCAMGFLAHWVLLKLFGKKFASDKE